MEFSLAIESMPSGSVLKVCGELDMATAERTREALVGLPGPERIVDLSECTFIDSIGLSLLVRAHGATLGGFSIVAPAYGHVRQLIDLTQLNQLIPVADTGSGALELAERLGALRLPDNHTGVKAASADSRES